MRYVSADNREEYSFAIQTDILDWNRYVTLIELLLFPLPLQYLFFVSFSFKKYLLKKKKKKKKEKEKRKTQIFTGETV